MEREDRRSKRKLVNKLVEFLLIPSVAKRTLDGLITDISDSGLCLLTNSQLKHGQRLVIQGESYLSDKIASVRWTQKFDDIFYKIGLEFTEDQAFLNMKDKRLYKSLTAKNLNAHGKMALANYAKVKT